MGTSTGHPFRTLALLGAFLVLGVGGAIYASLTLEPGEATSAAEGAGSTLVNADAAPAAETKTTASSTKAAVYDSDAAHVHGVVRLYRTKAPVEGLALT